MLPALGYPAAAPLRVHPMHLVDAECQAVWRLYQEWRGGGMAAGALPFRGGTAEQPAALMAAFAILAETEQMLKPNE